MPDSLTDCVVFAVCLPHAVREEDVVIDSGRPTKTSASIDFLVIQRRQQRTSLFFSLLLRYTLAACLGNDTQSRGGK